MLIYIDFDGTISPDHFPKPLLAEPFSGCAEKIRRWSDEGNTIVIYSCRANPAICDQDAIDEMVAYLKKHGIPYNAIDKSKPVFDLLIDDRAVGWNPTFWTAPDSVYHLRKK